MPLSDNFTFVRLQKLALIVFIGFMLVVFLIGFNTIQSRARDVKRRGDIKALVYALDLYYYQYNRYPESIDNLQGWEISNDYKGNKANFINKLIEAGFFERPVKDPINDFSYQYRYQKFSAGEYGCKNSFYILQITNFESSTNDHGQGYCPKYNWAAAMPNGYTVQSFN